jgi:thiol-disulfide isomerase/thioredoxin
MQLIPATPAPELKEITGWANSSPLSIRKDLKGKVIILDCWTYTCIFCLRTIPILGRLQQKYGRHGLQVVQAHSAEYQFATDHANISKALARYRVSNLPVAFDTKNKTWEAYGNMFWPKHVIIDQSGFIRYEHAGYGEITEFEPVISELLEEAGNKPSSVDYDEKNPDDEIFDTYGMHFPGMAPEICVGYSRLRRFGNNQTFKPDEPSVAVDPGSHADNVVYLRGKWIWRREGVEFAAGAKQEQKSAIIMRYNSAKRVHAIIGTADGKPAKAEIRLDGNPLTKEQLGRDAKFDDDDGSTTTTTTKTASIVNVEWPFMHNLVRTDKPEVHEIEVLPRTDNFVFYTFVFG